MVSLSSTEMLKNMVENYGYGSYLFSQLSLEQLDRLHEIKPDFKDYLDMLFSGKIYDPEALSILEEKYKNNLYLHQPKMYELVIGKDEIQTFLDTDNIDILQSGIQDIIQEKLLDIAKQFRKGDVIYASMNDDYEGYYIYSDNIPLQNVYFRIHKLEIITPIRYMDILGSTPVNYWNDLNIPKLSFEFELGLVLDKIAWGKMKIENQNYLVGEFVYQKKKVFVMAPIEKFKTAGDKLAVSLQISNRKIFQTSDPKGIIPGNPVVFFADIESELENMQFETEDKEELYD